MSISTQFISGFLFERIIKNAFRAGTKLGEASWRKGEFEGHEEQAIRNAKRTVRREERKAERKNYIW